MNELDTTREREFIWRRLGEAFPLSSAEDSTLILLAVVGGLFLLAVGVFLGTILKRGRSDSVVYWLTASARAGILLLPAILLLVGKFGKLPQPKPLWWTLTVGTFLLAVVLTALSYLRDSRNHFGWWILTFLGWAAVGVGAAALPVLLVSDSHAYLSEGWWVWNGVIAWWTVPVLMLGLGVVVAAGHVLREPRHAGLAWTPLLAQLRCLVYLILAVAFLMPAMQEREKTRKQSRVLILLDISPSVANTSDELSKVPGQKPKTRLDKILDFLTDANAVTTDGSDKANLLKNLADKNPVYAFRFGKQLDDDAQVFPLKSAPWTRDEWASWVKYDFRPVALRGLSDEGKRVVMSLAAWKADEPGNADWASAWAKTPEVEAVPEKRFTPADEAVLKANRTKLLTRVDVARSVVTGTDVPGSLVDLIKRESGNMVKGVIVFSDGRSNPGSAGTASALRELAVKEKIPVFTVTVGEVRENVSIDITDLQAPSVTGPDEPVKVTVSVDGIGLPGQETDVNLDIFMPGQDAKKDTPVHTLTKKVKFAPGDPPRGEVEFVLDPDDKLPAVMTEPSKKEGRILQFKASVGKENWKLVARVAADKREIFDGKEHVTPPREMLVQDRILRVLLVASAPSREYQTLRTLLVREENQGRARVCVLIQNEGGLKGDIVQDVEPEQVLTRFPDRLDLTNKVRSDDKADRFYNLNEYDLVIMFDPDWDEKAVDGSSRISDQSIKNLATWVDNLGGGLMYVAAPLYTPKLARADESGRLRPLVDVLPVEPLDAILLSSRGIPREPRRLLLTPTPLANLLRLEEDIVKDSTDPSYQVAGWEKLFTGQDRYAPTGKNDLDFKPTRGIYSAYPVKHKRGASVLAEFVDLDDKQQPKKTPYLVVTQPARGRSAFLGSGEIYRVRQADVAYYDRFWIKMCRFLVANRESKASRGRVLISKEFVSGGPVRVQARILGPNARPYPSSGPSSINASMRIEQLKASGEFVKVIGNYPLPPAKGSGELAEYYRTQMVADPKLMPPDEFIYRVVIDVPDSGEPLTDTFRLRRSDPELDNLRPDFDAMRAMASSLDEVVPNIADQKTRFILRGTAADDTKAKLAFNLNETDKLKLIPQCIGKQDVVQTLRGKVDDLWDNEMEPPATAELATAFFTGNLFDGRLGRWGNLFALLTLLLAIGAGVGSYWVPELMWATYAFTAATVAFVYLGNPFPLGDLTQQAYELFSLRSLVAPFQEDAAFGLQLGAVLAIVFAGVAVLGGVGAAFVAPLKWAAIGGTVLALLSIAPVLLFADTRLPTTAAATTDPYLLTIRWGMLLALPLGVLSLTCFVLSTFIGGFKWAGLTLLLLTGAAVYLAYPFPVGVVIAVVVSLLSFEWMTRKLMRLA